MSEEEQEVQFSPKMLPGLGGEPTQAILHDIDQTLKQSQMLPPVSMAKDHKTADDDNIGNKDTFRITAIMKVETDIIANISASLIG